METLEIHKSEHVFAIELKDITIGYGDKPVLRDINFSVPIGSCWSVIGPSGVGKTTLFKLITGLLSPMDGKITILGLDFISSTNRKKLRGKIGYIPQNLGLVANLNVKANILCGALGRTPLIPSLLGLHSPSDLENAEIIMKLLKIDHLKNKKIYTLSGGEKRRVAIARALLHRPQILVADELLSELDAVTATIAMEQIKRMQFEFGTTVILIEHNVEAALKYSDQVVVLSDDGMVGAFSSDKIPSVDFIKEIMTAE